MIHGKFTVSYLVSYELLSVKVAQGHKCCTIEWSNGIEGIEH
jgi:hypothetical protein